MDATRVHTVAHYESPDLRGPRALGELCPHPTKPKALDMKMIFSPNSSLPNVAGQQYGGWIDGEGV